LISTTILVPQISFWKLKEKSFTRKNLTDERDAVNRKIIVPNGTWGVTITETMTDVELWRVDRKKGGEYLLIQ
jgi:hypothetical protein